MIIDDNYIGRMDQELMANDVPLHARPFHVGMAWMRAKKIEGDILASELWAPLMAAYKRIYPSGNFAMPAMFTGGVGLRDQMFPARVDVAYGTIPVKPLDCIDISRSELEVVWRRNPDQVWRAMYAVADLWDFAYSLEDLRGQNVEADQLWRGARSAIAGTARSLEADLDLDAAVQGACLAAELALKGVLAFLGWSESRRRKLGHDLVDQI